MSEAGRFFAETGRALEARRQRLTRIRLTAELVRDGNDACVWCGYPFDPGDRALVREIGPSWGPFDFDAVYCGRSCGAEHRAEEHRDAAENGIKLSR